MTMRKLVATTLAISLVLVSSGCATRLHTPAQVSLPQLLKPEHRASIRTVGVMWVDGPGDVATGGYSSGKGKGAAKGAGHAVLGYLGALSEGGGCDGGWGCGLFYVLAIALVPFVAVGGAVAGAATTVSKKNLKNMEAYLADASSAEGPMREHVIERLVAYPPEGLDLELVALDQTPEAGETGATDYQDLAGRGIDTVLELSAMHVIGTGEGGNPPAQWKIGVGAALVSTRDGSTLHGGSWVYTSGVRNLRKWVRNDLVMLREEIDRACGDLAKKVVDELFLLYPLRAQGGPAPAENSKRRARNKPVTVYGPRPLHPLPPGSLEAVGKDGNVRLKDWASIGSLHPTLRWETFPPENLEELEGRVSDVTYELKIAKGDQNTPHEAIYDRTGLSAPEHRVERLLLQRTRYFWTVRAHFELDGSPRVTEWGSIHSRSYRAAEVPNVYSYRFKTKSNATR